MRTLYSHRRTGASALLALAAGLSHADLRLVIPSEGPLPLYFSSTSSRISARAWLSGTSGGLESSRLKLNGEVVYGKTFDPQQGELPSSWRAHVMFDSTHWGAEATSCVVRLEAKEAGQPEQHAEATVPVKNRAAGYILSHFVAAGDSLTPTTDALEAMGYGNQAEMGWAEQVPNAILPVFTTKFWSELSLGRTVAQARANALTYVYAWHLDKYNVPFVYTSRLFGDEFARQKHVYTGTNNLPPVLPGMSPWFRVVTTGTEGW